ncbi:MAG TPA: DUF899 domain-containing protein [Sphingomicrobium sp.]|jgi:predicted dithiol-disulfide oxidoreductase (DUF899 family)|nr:DUF899 domain-containing protein [Sphingomicrobium sp.]
MTDHRVASRDEWLKERVELLKAEKELTRASDALALRRQGLPWVKVDKDYAFDTDQGRALLRDLFSGRSQLIVYHFMFGPDFKAGCPSCSAIADGFDGFWEHLAHHDVMFWAISRAPLEKLDAYKRRMRWSFPWASSFGSDFNYDFAVGITEEQQCEEGYEYNFAAQPPSDPPRNPWSESAGADPRAFMRELPGMSSFVLEDGEVYHAYSAYARGLDGLWGMYQWLDRAPLGRNEDGAGLWWKRRDKYGAL